MTRTGRPRPPEVQSCVACTPGRRCPEHTAPRQKLNGHRQTPICSSCGKTPCRPSCPKFEAPPGPSSVPPVRLRGDPPLGADAESSWPPARLPGGRPKNPELDVPVPVALTPAALLYDKKPIDWRDRTPPITTSFYRRLERLQAIERAATELTRLWEEAPLGTTSAAALRAAEAELRRVVRST